MPRHGLIITDQLRAELARKLDPYDGARAACLARCALLDVAIDGRAAMLTYPVNRPRVGARRKRDATLP